MPDIETPKVEHPYIVLVVDESGSMNVSRGTTIVAINEYLNGLKAKLPAETLVTLVKFDSDAQVNLTKVFDAQALGTIREVTTADYTPRGMTPLNDAIGVTITDLDKTLTAQPGPVFFAIVTDGGENSSKEFSREAVRKMVDDRTKGGWTFSFIGVDIAAYDASSGYGINALNTVSAGRATMGSAIAGMTRGVVGKAAMYATLRASGADDATVMGSYTAFNQTDAMFTPEEKAAVEKPKTPPTP